MNIEQLKSEIEGLEKTIMDSSLTWEEESYINVEIIDYKNNIIKILEIENDLLKTQLQNQDD